MKRLLILTVLGILALGSAGCAHDPCRPGLFGRMFHRDRRECCSCGSGGEEMDGEVGYMGGGGGCACGGGGGDVMMAPPTTIIQAPSR